MRAYLENVCDSLDNRRAVRPWRNWTRCAVSPIALGIIMNAGCSPDDERRSGEPSGSGGTPGSELSVDSAPTAEWDSVASDFESDDVEVVDPHKVLDAEAFTVTRVANALPDGVLPEGGENAPVWEFEPDGPLAQPVVIRFLLDEPLAPDTPLELLSNGELVVAGDPSFTETGWSVQSVGRVTGDGRKAMFAVDHLSQKTWVERDLDRMSFVSGTFCDGTSADGPVYGLREKSCETCDESLFVGPIHEALPKDPEDGRFARLVDVSKLSDLSANLRIKDEECAQNWPQCGDDRLAYATVVDPLRELASAVAAHSCHTLTLRVTEMYDSGTPMSAGEHEAFSLHYEGRAADLTLVLSSGSATTDTTYPLAYGRLAQLAQNAGFGFVWYEDALRVHASADRLVDNQNETISDPMTGLMWEKVPWPDGGVTWEMAREACGALVIDGYDDWRLPELPELSTMLMGEAGSGGRYTEGCYWRSDVFEGMCGPYWTNTVEDCDDGIDNDFDGAIDDLDPGCFFGACYGIPLEICANGVDDDFNGEIDEADCVLSPVEICDNGVDDDADCLIDMYDCDCDSETCSLSFNASTVSFETGEVAENIKTGGAFYRCVRLDVEPPPLNP